MYTNCHIWTKDKSNNILYFKMSQACFFISRYIYEYVFWYVCDVVCHLIHMVGYVGFDLVCDVWLSKKRYFQFDAHTNISILGNQK